jgi:competence protein ComEA
VNKAWMLILFGLLMGLFVTGAILLVARPIQGTPITLQSAPLPTSTFPPANTPTPSPILVQIEGEVLSPGVYTLSKDSRLDDLIQSAGGLTDNADQGRINLVIILQDGDFYYIPAVEETIPETAANSPDNLQTTDGNSIQYPLNLNLANQEELESLPGIGPSKASDIISYRDAHGPFESVDDLVNITGIGQNTVDSLRDYLIVE